MVNPLRANQSNFGLLTPNSLLLLARQTSKVLCFKRRCESSVKGKCNSPPCAVEAYTWQGGWDAQFSSVRGRMRWIHYNVYLYLFQYWKSKLAELSGAEL